MSATGATGCTSADRHAAADAIVAAITGPIRSAGLARMRISPRNDTLVPPMLIVPLLAALVVFVAPPPAAAEGECVIVAPLDGGPETVVGGSECDRRTLPASTFKIPHALIALDTGVVTERTVMKWDHEKKDFPAWERDHTLDSAIRSSVVWFFQRAARSIGRERELAHLRAFNYGSQTFAREVDLFWLNGDLTISPREQI